MARFERGLPPRSRIAWAVDDPVPHQAPQPVVQEASVVVPKPKRRLWRQARMQCVAEQLTVHEKEAVLADHEEEEQLVAADEDPEEDVFGFGVVDLDHAE